MNKNETRQPCVYGLKVGDQFFYVGKTTTNVKTRWWEHRGRARNGHTAPVYAYMREIGIDNCEVVVLDDEPNNEAYWIKRLLDENHPIQNALGRNGVANSHSDDSKRKIGQANAGGTSWIAGKTGVEAGWTEERRHGQVERIRAYNAKRGSTQTSVN